MPHTHSSIAKQGWHSDITHDLEAFWMPFSANRQFKSKPRMFVSAKGMYYTTDNGQEVLDATAGLWCCNAGHAHSKVVEAVQKQVQELDYAPTFQIGHPKAFELSSRLSAMMPGDIDHIFFTKFRIGSRRYGLKNYSCLSQYTW